MLMRPRQQGLSYMIAGNVNWLNHFGKCLALSTKAKHIYNLLPDNFIYKYISNRYRNIHARMHTKACARMFIAP